MSAENPSCKAAVLLFLRYAFFFRAPLFLEREVVRKIFFSTCLLGVILLASFVYARSHPTSSSSTLLIGRCADKSAAWESDSFLVLSSFLLPRAVMGIPLPEPSRAGINRASNE